MPRLNQRRGMPKFVKIYGPRAACPLLDSMPVLGSAPVLGSGRFGEVCRIPDSTGFWTACRFSAARLPGKRGRHCHTPMGLAAPRGNAASRKKRRGISTPDCQSARFTKSRRATAAPRNQPSARHRKNQWGYSTKIRRNTRFVRRRGYRPGAPKDR